MSEKLKKLYASLNLRYFSGELHPIEKISLGFVEDFSEGAFIDTRGDMAAVAIVTETGHTWRKEISSTDQISIEINRTLEAFPKLLEMVLAHEMVHIKLPGANHGSKAWNSEVRRLQGLGLFLRIF